MLIFALAHGVTINSIDLPGLQISKFYIKLDKKLLIEIDKLNIGTKSEKGSAVQEMDRIGKSIQYLPFFFEKIQINDATIGGEHIHLLFYDDVFYVETDKLQLATRLAFEEQKKILYAKIKILYFTKPHLTVSGEFAYDTHTNAWIGEGRYHGLNMDGNFSIWHKEDIVGFDIDAKPTDSIKPLIDFIDPPHDIKVWIYPKIPAKRYVLHYLRGKVKLRSDGSIEFDPANVEGYATAYRARIHFHPDVPPVFVERIDVTYKNDVLGFRLHHPLYGKKRLDGSYVRIRNLVGKDGRTELDLHILAKSRFDKSIRQILRAYGITVPFVQTQGTTESVVDLTIALADGSVKTYRGEFRSETTKLLFDSGLSVPVKNLHVLLKNGLVTIEPCQVSYGTYLNGTLEGSIDLEKRQGDFHTFIDRFELTADNRPLLDIRKKPLRLKMEFNRHLYIDIPSLKTALRYTPGKMLKLSLFDLARYKQHFKGPLLAIEEGTVTLIRQSENTVVDAQILYRNSIFLQKQKPLERFNIHTSIDPGKMDIRINRNIHLHREKEVTRIDYDDIDINIVELHKLLKPWFRGKSDTEKRETAAQKIEIHGKNSTLYTRFVHLKCDTIKADITLGDPYHIIFETHHDSGSIRGVIDGDLIKIAGRNLSDEVAQGIPPLDNLYGGYFDFDTVGKIDDFNGTVVARDTLWAKSAVYNNVLAALNSVPAILMLKDPGFSDKGFKIDKAVIHYHYKTPIFRFVNIDIKGKSADIFGKGHIDFAKRNIDVKMRIKFLETISATMHKIPVAGYILFGKDGTISVGLSVEGPLDNPHVKTTAAKDLVTAPINIIKRTITFPFHLFE